MLIACLGHCRTAWSHFSRRSSGGFSWSTYRKLSSRTSNTSGTMPMQMALLSQRSKSTTTFQAIVVPPETRLGTLGGPTLQRGASDATRLVPRRVRRCAYERCERRRGATTGTAPTTRAAMPMSTYDGVSDEPVNASAAAAAAGAAAGAAPGFVAVADLTRTTTSPPGVAHAPV